MPLRGNFVKIECGKYDILCQAEQKLTEAINAEAIGYMKRLGWDKPTFQAKPETLKVAPCLADEFAFVMDSTSNQVNAYYLEGKVHVCQNGSDRSKINMLLDEDGCGHFVEPKYLKKFRRIG
jgi:hypothetical protein